MILADLLPEVGCCLLLRCWRGACKAAKPPGSGFPPVESSRFAFVSFNLKKTEDVTQIPVQFAVTSFNSLISLPGATPVASIGVMLSPFSENSVLLWSQMASSYSSLTHAMCDFILSIFSICKLLIVIMFRFCQNAHLKDQADLKCDLGRGQFGYMLLRTPPAQAFRNPWSLMAGCPLPVYHVCSTVYTGYTSSADISACRLHISLQIFKLLNLNAVYV